MNLCLVEYVKKDLCLSCYNKIHYKAYEIYKNIEKKNI